MAQDTPSRDLDKVIVRLPDGMRDELKSYAEANNRSMNAEIVARLRQSLPTGDQLVEQLGHLSVSQMIADHDARLSRASARIESLVERLEAKVRDGDITA